MKRYLPSPKEEKEEQQQKYNKKHTEKTVPAKARCRFFGCQAEIEFGDMCWDHYKHEHCTSK